MLRYEGSIEDVLRSGEYDSGDDVIVSYDELYDLVEQAQQFKNFLFSEYIRVEGTEASVLRNVERITNRPLHPCLGGKSPYSEFLPL